MKQLCTVLMGMKRSGIREIMDLAAGMGEVIHLEVGEPCFDTPPHIVEAAHRAALDGFTKYSPNAGLRALRELIVETTMPVHDVKIGVENIVVTTGAVGGLATSRKKAEDAPACGRG